MTETPVASEGESTSDGQGLGTVKIQGLVVSTAMALFMLGLLGLRVCAAMAQSGVPLPGATDLERVRAGIAQDGVPEDVWVVITDVVDVSGADLSALWFADDRVPVYRLPDEFLDPDSTMPLSARVEQASEWALVLTRDSAPIGAA